ncbi:nitroreductase/quinone reductase family protein [Rhizohabitans arisaemae]|uniref:nitroreductase/quinone reductase family protein n=1 Tax=Rhizohabitans arisaemae TaxID=2720610 RepID=UPI0024B0EC87|nr:nitroreductase/quinone reductase family protein [Rhizohabitans arisaemae]
MTTDFNQQIIEEFRANEGRVSGRFEGARLLLLTTVGAKSGVSRTTPVGYLPDGDRMLIIGSAGGSPAHPAWYHNIRANPQVKVEYGVFTYPANAVVLEGEERDRLFARAAEADPGWAEYQAGIDRVIPVVALYPIADGPPPGPFGDSLKKIHEAFRRELALIRKELAESGKSLGAQLRVNCLTFCQGLEFHHRSEDGGVFPALAGRDPALDEVLAKLGREHEVVAELLERLRTVLAGPDVGTEAVLAEVDLLIEQLEAHLDYEERELVAILNQVSP